MVLAGVAAGVGVAGMGWILTDGGSTGTGMTAAGIVTKEILIGCVIRVR